MAVSTLIAVMIKSRGSEGPHWSPEVGGDEEELVEPF